MLEFGKQTRGGQAKIISDFCSRLATVVPIKDSIVICITHNISNTSGYGASIIEKTPSSLLYQIDYKLKGFKSTAWTLSEGADPIGQVVDWLCECSGLRGPGRKCQSYIRYGQGIDEVAELVNFAIDLGLISKAGAWYSIEGTEGKYQGFEKLCDFLKEKDNIEVLGNLDKQVSEMLI
jgi:recombination protein RecA